MKRTQSTADILETFDIDQRTLTRWVKRGCPCTNKGRGRGLSRLFDKGEVASWMKANKLTGDMGRPEDSSEALKAAKLRKENALAEKHEIAVKKEKALLVFAADVEKQNIQKFSLIRSKLLSIPGTVAMLLVGKTETEIERELEARVRETLVELSKS